jgi:uncharacterized protein YkwD
MSSRFWEPRQCPLRAVGAAVLAAGLLVALLSPGRAPAAGGSSHLTLTALELSTVQAINDVRVSFGVRPLAVSPALFGSASLHCEQMVSAGYFGHQGPDGSSFTDRVETYYPPGDAGYYAVGENLLWTLRPMTPAQMVAAWMRSREHRANLLDPNWSQLAVATLTVPSAPGIFDGRPVTVVTVDFGVRR